MKKLLWIALGISLTAPTYAWDNAAEDMKTMSANMSGSAVRVVKSYPGMFRGWSDNQGFKTGALVSGEDNENHYRHNKRKKAKRHYRRKHVSRHHKRHHRRYYKRSRSGVCIAKCYCQHH